MSAPAMFTKLIVSDEEAASAYYEAVYQLKPVKRITGVSDGEPFREIILAKDADWTKGTLVMFNYTERPVPRDQQVILGFVTDDLDSLVGRIESNGGKLVGPVRDVAEECVRLVFATDPFGALTENVQMLL